MTPPPYTTANEGDNVTFQCAFTNAVSITWLRDGVAMEMSDSYIISEGQSESSLTLISVDRVLNISYSCVAATPTNSSERVDFQLLVYCKSLPLSTLGW